MKSVLIIAMISNILAVTIPPDQAPDYTKNCPAYFAPCYCFDDRHTLHFICENFGNITQVQNSLRKYKDLVKILDIIHPSISEIPSDIFQDVCLIELTLKLPLIDVPDSVFVSQAECMKWLIINTGTMEQFPINALMHLKSLKILTFTNNCITELKGPLWKLPIWKLVLDDNSIARIDSDFFPRSLRVLSLRNNHLKSLNDSLLPLTDLRLLYLTNNSIESLFDELTNLKKLEYLKADMNHLEYMGPTKLILTKLKEVDLSRNRLPIFRFGLFLFFPSLEKADLSNNLITRFKFYDDLENLIILSLAYNQISSVPGSLYKAENLQIVSLKGNRIRTIREHDFIHTSKLKIIDLSCNLLTELPEHVFSSVPNLTKLSLEHNQLKSLPISFTNRRNLQYLYLDGNPLLTEIYECFNRLKKLGMSLNVIKQVGTIHVDEPNYVINKSIRIGFGNSAFIWKLYTVY